MDSATKRQISVGGKTFTLGCLPFAKNRIVVPSCSFALKAINRSQPPESEPLNVTATDHMYLAVFEAVNHADPKVTREEFNSWGIYLPDLIQATITVALQTGVLVQSTGKPTSGEA